MLCAHRLFLVAVFAAVTACSSSESSDAPAEDVGTSDTAEVIGDTDATVPADVSPDVPSAEDSSADTTTPDAADSAASDAADSSTAETSSADTSASDTTASDTSPSDTSTPSCGVTGKPCCGETAKICDTGSVCAAGTCVAAAGACVRASDCTGGVCGGPTLCDGRVCFACGVSTGAGALWSACTSSSQCASGVCDVLRGVCSSACAPEITGDADCTALDPNAVCAAPILELSSGSSTVSGVAGMCARRCLRDADCPTSQSCRLTRNGATNRLDLTCMPTPSGASVGSGGSCTSADVCLRGSCLPITSSGTLHCTSLCVTNADCAASVAKTCRAFSFYKQTIYGCGA